MKVRTYNDGSTIDLKYFETAQVRAIRHAQERQEFGFVMTVETPVYNDSRHRYARSFRGELGWHYAPLGRPVLVGNDGKREREVQLMRRLHKKPLRTKPMRGDMDPDLIAAKWEELNVRQGV